MTLDIEKVSLKDKIVSTLIEKIIDGEIEVGEKLKEAHLAKAFGVSQAPVREAIISLVSLGILEHKVNVGARVKAFTQTETIEIYQARDAMETYAVEHIQQFDKLDALVETYDFMLQAAKINDIKLFVKYDKIFHILIMEMSENKLLHQLWKEQYTKSSVINIVKGFESSLSDIVKMHLPIIEAMKNASSTQCKNAITKHYKTIINNIKDTK